MIGIEPHVKLRLKIHVLVNLPVMIKRKLVFPGIRLQTGIEALAVNFVGIIVAPDRQGKDTVYYISNNNIYSLNILSGEEICKPTTSVLL